MRLLVCGGRDFSDWDLLNDELCWYCPHVIIHGGARGADSMAGEWARAEGATVESVFPADWKKHGKAAGLIRNQRMLDEGKPDMVLAFPGGRGTADMIQRARKAGVRVIIAGAQALPTAPRANAEAEKGKRKGPRQRPSHEPRPGQGPRL